MCETHLTVRERGVAAVKRLGGNVNDETVVLGQFITYFGQHRRKTFKLVVENALGYAAWLVNDMLKEQPSNAPLSKNKQAFKKYLTSLTEGRKKKEEKEKGEMLQIKVRTLFNACTCDQSILHINQSFEHDLIGKAIRRPILIFKLSFLFEK